MRLVLPYNCTSSWSSGPEHVVGRYRHVGGRSEGRYLPVEDVVAEGPQGGLSALLQWQLGDADVQLAQDRLRPQAQGRELLGEAGECNGSEARQRQHAVTGKLVGILRADEIDELLPLHLLFFAELRCVLVARVATRLARLVRPRSRVAARRGGRWRQRSGTRRGTRARGQLCGQVRNRSAARRTARCAKPGECVRILLQGRERARGHPVHATQADLLQIVRCGRDCGQRIRVDRDHHPVVGRQERTQPIEFVFLLGRQPPHVALRLIELVLAGHASAAESLSLAAAHAQLVHDRVALIRTQTLQELGADVGDRGITRLPGRVQQGNRHAMPPISIDQAIRARLTLI